MEELNELILPGGAREVTQFSPEETKRNVAKMDAAIDYAKKIKEWTLLTMAVQSKIKEQRDFVAWWDANVRGKGQKRNSADRGYFVEDAESLTQITHQQVSKWAARLKDEAKYEERLFGVEWREAMGKLKTLHDYNTGENDWYTPTEYIEAARGVMGGIDLDPASSDIAQETVKAEKHFTAETDGLKQEWHGRVWMNPPYGQPLIHHFAEKLITEVVADRVSEAIVLTHNSTDTHWFHRLEEIALRVCFTKGRISFIRFDGEAASPTQGQAFFYIGEDAARFDAVFKLFGFIR